MSNVEKIGCIYDKKENGRYVSCKDAHLSRVGFDSCATITTEASYRGRTNMVIIKHPLSGDTPVTPPVAPDLCEISAGEQFVNIPFNTTSSGTCYTIKAQYARTSAANLQPGHFSSSGVLVRKKAKCENENHDGLVYHGNLYGDFGSGYAGGVWDKRGLCPTLTANSGGGRMPHVIEYEQLSMFDSDEEKVAQEESKPTRAMCRIIPSSGKIHDNQEVWDVNRSIPTMKATQYKDPLKVLVYKEINENNEE